MRQPQLSGMQYAYLFHQEAFLERIRERAERLAEDGYSVEATGMPCEFLVLCPMRVNAYRVHALEQTCTCPFMTQQAHDEPLAPQGCLVLCKHVLGLKRLLKKTRERLLREGAECEAYRLWAHAMAVLSMERLRQEDDTPGNSPAIATHPRKGEEGYGRNGQASASELSRRAGARSGGR